MKKILVVEDEAKLASFLTRGLQAEGYDCIWVAQAQDILPQVSNQHFALVILDRLMQGQDNINLVPQLRQLQPEAMILVLTALHDIDDKVDGLKAGADDYLGKPFDFDELLARIEALLRRTERNTCSNTSHKIEQGGLTLSPDSQRVWVFAQEVELTHLEFALLRYFLSNPDRVLSRERILSKVWSTTTDPMTNIVDVYIRRLRQKLTLAAQASEPNIGGEHFIQTLRGTGYRLGRCQLN